MGTCICHIQEPIQEYWELSWNPTYSQISLKVINLQQFLWGNGCELSGVDNRKWGELWEVTANFRNTSLQKIISGYLKSLGKSTERKKKGQMQPCVSLPQRLNSLSSRKLPEESEGVCQGFWISQRAEPPSRGSRGIPAKPTTCNSEEVLLTLQNPHS